ncbi:MAG: DUF116 domain-containing protein [Nitrospirota bacterium]|jgi:hypothetical protein
MAKAKYRPLEGKTYSLFGEGASTERYYKTIRRMTDALLKEIPDEEELLSLIQRLGDKKSRDTLRKDAVRRKLGDLIENTVRESLSAYTTGVKKHLKKLPLRKRYDDILSTGEAQYHLYMLEIELVNRIYRDEFKRSAYKFALIAHCLRDFREKCETVPGDIEALCRHCTKECFINVGSVLLERYGINPYISIEMDQEKLFKKLKEEHPSIGALGVACVPELARGMRLCIRLGIAPVGVPLDANRCARWMKKARETTFSLEELEALLG